MQDLHNIKQPFNDGSKLQYTLDLETVNEQKKNHITAEAWTQKVSKFRRYEKHTTINIPSICSKIQPLKMILTLKKQISLQIYRQL